MYIYSSDGIQVHTEALPVCRAAELCRLMQQDDRIKSLYAAMNIPLGALCRVCTKSVTSVLQGGVCSGSISHSCTVKAYGSRTLSFLCWQHGRSLLHDAALYISLEASHRLR